jgi:uncharacterized protein (TIGR00251 family)
MADSLAAVTAVSGGVILRVKVVPGASRSRVMGLLGDRLKVTVAAPPEAGKANRAVCELLAEILKIPARNVSVTSGRAQPQKSISVIGVSMIEAAAALSAFVK